MASLRSYDSSTNCLRSKLVAACLLLAVSLTARAADPIDPRSLLEDARQIVPRDGEMTFTVRSEAVPQLKATMTISSHVANDENGNKRTRTQITIARGSEILRSSVIIENEAGKCRLLTHTKAALFYPTRGRSHEEPLRLIEFAKLTKLVSEHSKAPGSGSDSFEIEQTLDEERLKEAHNTARSSNVEGRAALPQTITYYIRKTDRVLVGYSMHDKNGRVLASTFFDRVEVRLRLDPSLFEIPKDFAVIFPKDEREFSQRLTENELANPQRGKSKS